jgi:hypothetical protein
MKPLNWIIAVLAAGCLVFGEGCKKKEQPSEWNTSGVRVSLSELRQAFENTQAPEIQTCLNDAAVGLRYGQYAKVLASLEKLAGNSALTAQQKAVTAKVIGQVKQLAEKGRPR